MNTTVVGTSLGQLSAKITVGTRVFTLMCNLRIQYTTDQHQLTHPLVQFHQLNQKMKCIRKYTHSYKHEIPMIKLQLPCRKTQVLPNR